MTDPEPNGPSSDPTAANATGDEPGGRPRAERQDRAPRNRTAIVAWVAVVAILMGVLSLVIYAFSGSPVTPKTVHRALVSNGVVASVSKVPPSVFDTVGVTSPDAPLVAPTVLSGQPPLTSAGKPEVLYVGAEFCPFCGSERWALVVALSRFGHFSALKNMQSAPSSVFPNLQTFSFVGASYASRYVSFTGIELYSDTADAAGVFTRITKLNPAQAALVSRYGRISGQGTAPSSYPFVDVDNKMATSTSGFSPALIVKQSQSEIANELSQPGNTTGQAIVASANYLTAGICAATTQQPSSVCTSKGVRAATESLGSA